MQDPEAMLCWVKRLVWPKWLSPAFTLFFPEAIYSCSVWVCNCYSKRYSRTVLLTKSSHLVVPLGTSSVRVLSERWRVTADKDLNQEDSQLTLQAHTTTIFPQEPICSSWDQSSPQPVTDQSIEARTITLQCTSAQLSKAPWHKYQARLPGLHVWTVQIWRQFEHRTGSQIYQLSFYPSNCKGRLLLVSYLSH